MPDRGAERGTWPWPVALGLSVLIAVPGPVWGQDPVAEPRSVKVHRPGAPPEVVGGAADGRLAAHQVPLAVPLPIPTPPAYHPVNVLGLRMILREQAAQRRDAALLRRYQEEFRQADAERAIRPAVGVLPPLDLLFEPDGVVRWPAFAVPGDGDLVQLRLRANAGAQAVFKQFRAVGIARADTTVLARQALDAYARRVLLRSGSPEVFAYFRTLDSALDLMARPPVPPAP